MKVTAVFMGCLALAVAHTNHWLAGNAAIKTVPHVQWIPASKNVAWSANSAIPVKVARSLFRTFGLEQPSDTEIMSFADATGYSDVNSVEKLRSLYAEPVLIFLEDADNNVVAYYADSGMNTIKAYPKTNADLKSMLSASNAVVLAYRPERMLYPVDRLTVSGRFFAPKNFRMEPLIASSRAAENYPAIDAPIVLRKFEIPSLYAETRSPYSGLNIDTIPHAYKSPVALKTIESSEYPPWKKAIPSPVYAIDADSSLSAYRMLPAEPLEAKIVSDFCAKNPLACSNLESVNADSDVISATIVKAYPEVPAIHLSHPAVLKSAPILDTDSICAKNPLACSSSARAAVAGLPSAMPIPHSLMYIPKSLETSVPILQAKSPITSLLSALNSFAVRAASPMSLLGPKLMAPEAGYKYSTPLVSADSLEASSPLVISTSSPAWFPPITLRNPRLIAPKTANTLNAPSTVSADSSEAFNPNVVSAPSPTPYVNANILKTHPAMPTF